MATQQHLSAKFLTARLGQMTVPELLRGAHEQISTHGWVCSQCMDLNVYGSELSIQDALFAAAGWRSWYHDERAPRDREQAEHRRQSEMQRLTGVITQSKKARTVHSGAVSCLAEAIGTWDLEMWNDRVCGTKDEALQALSRAIEVAESRGL